MEKFFMGSEEVDMKQAGEVLRGEMLPGSYPGVSIFKNVLKAKKRFDVTTYGVAEKTQIFFFTKGWGYVGTEDTAHYISEEAVFVPLYDIETIFIHAATDLEFLEILVDLTPEDTANMKKVRMTLPYFSLMSNCMRYEEDFKGAGMISYSIIRNRFLGRVSMGAVLADGPNVNGVHSHDNLEQWYYGLKDAYFEYTADGKTYTVKDGDLTYTTKAIPHASETGEGHKMRYVWFELMS
jgi:hypothetical protein